MLLYKTWQVVLQVILVDQWDPADQQDRQYPGWRKKYNNITNLMSINTWDPTLSIQFTYTVSFRTGWSCGTRKTPVALLSLFTWWSDKSNKTRMALSVRNSTLHCQFEGQYGRTQRDDTSIWHAVKSFNGWRQTTDLINVCHSGPLVQCLVVSWVVFRAAYLLSFDARVSFQAG